MKKTKEAGKRHPAMRAERCFRKTIAGVLSTAIVFTGMPAITAFADAAPDENGIILISTEDDLNDAIAYVNDRNEGEFIISLQNDIILNSENEVLTVDAEGVTVTVLGNGHTIDDEDDAAGHVLGASGGTLNLGAPDGSDTLTITSGKEEHATALIYVTGGTVNMYDGVRLENNHVSTSNVYGGAVHIESGTFNMYGGEIDGCSAHYGGAIAASGGTLNIFGGEIDKNDAVGGHSRGSAIYVTGSGTEANISNITIEGNELGDEGDETEAADEQLYGTLTFYSGCKAVLDNVTVKDNYGFDGGGIYINGSDVTINNSTITGNNGVHDTTEPRIASTGAGGGIYATGSSAVLTVDNCEITDNRCDGSGGGILTNNLSYVTVRDSTISGNEAGATGGGMRIRNSSYVGSDNFTISGCTIDGNKTTLYYDEGEETFVGGGGIFTSYVYGTIEDCTITDNYSERGGGICVYVGGRVDVTNSTISGNSAVCGGGMYTHANATLDNTEISGNTANAGGGWLIETQVDYMGTTDSGINPVIEITNSYIVNNTAVYSDDIENVDGYNDSGIGGGINLVSGRVTADEGNVIANNTADIAAADIYAGPYHSSTANSGRLHEYEPTLSLTDAADMDQIYEADGKGVLIDGWYEDTADDRYTPDVDGEAYEDYANIDNGYVYGTDDEGNEKQIPDPPVYLTASYAGAVVTFYPGDSGKLEGDIGDDGEINNKVLKGDPLESVPEVKADEGYEFDHWEDEDGNAYTDSEILDLKIRGNMIFTAIYKEAEGSEEPDDSDYGVLTVIKKVENNPTDTTSYKFTLLLEPVLYSVESGSNAVRAESASDAAKPSDPEENGKKTEIEGEYEYTIKNADNRKAKSGIITLTADKAAKLIEFELKDGQKMVVHGLPEDMKYTVTEISKSDDYTTSAKSDSENDEVGTDDGYVYVTGIVEEDGSVTVIYTNTYEDEESEEPEPGPEEPESDPEPESGSESGSGSGSGSGGSGSGSHGSSSYTGNVRNVNTGKTGHWILEGGYLTLPDGSHPSNEYLDVDGEIWAFYTYGYAVNKRHTQYYTDEAIAAAGYIPEVTGTWETIGWWFEYDDGTYPHDEWALLEYNGLTYWYHFDVDGWMDDGWFTENGNTYYLDPVFDGWRGHRMTGWQLIGGYWYYFSEDPNTLGIMLKDHEADPGIPAYTS